MKLSRIHRNPIKFNGIKTIPIEFDGMQLDGVAFDAIDAMECLSYLPTTIASCKLVCISERMCICIC